MINRRSFVLAVLLAVGIGIAAPIARAAEPLEVVASFSILDDMVRQVGGDRVHVTTLVGPNGDAHVFQPSPAEARAVARAGLLVVNGLGFEGWMDRLITASGYKGPIVIASSGIQPQEMEAEADDHAHDDADGDHLVGRHEEHEQDEHHHHHDGLDPHAWQSLANARIYVRNITEALVKADAAGAESYEANAARYLAEIDAVDSEIRNAVAALPADRRKVVTSHDAFGYFASAYGIAFLAPVGISTEAEASAADIARLIRQIREERIPAVFLETISDPRLLEQIARETGATIGGTLYSDALSDPSGPAGTYLDMMRHNLRTLTSALGVS